ncbi:hypothetical protein RFI_06859 [Reticulomyxa filosa]|uniref:Uncharacterized protein n=1 Tax=Reticulomyxa filosa TaxID=46433 RepID=X6NY92_RETFI|nr:hypothetical protein RFI_06859 [Reticulomyxa filosa]|eukprot:ETO30262.1 hypothetical protein RFI_06859 [Reticulomyxa filosa]
MFYYHNKYYLIVNLLLYCNDFGKYSIFNCSLNPLFDKSKYIQFLFNNVSFILFDIPFSNILFFIFISFNFLLFFIFSHDKYPLNLFDIVPSILIFVISFISPIISSHSKYFSSSIHISQRLVQLLSIIIIVAPSKYSFISFVALVSFPFVQLLLLITIGILSNVYNNHQINVHTSNKIISGKEKPDKKCYLFDRFLICAFLHEFTIDLKKNTSIKKLQFQMKH